MQRCSGGRAPDSSRWTLWVDSATKRLDGNGSRRVRCKRKMALAAARLDSRNVQCSLMLFGGTLRERNALSAGISREEGHLVKGR